MHVADSSFVAQRESHFRLHCDSFSGSESFCSQEKTVGNLLSGLEEDKSESRVSHATFYYLFLTGHTGLLCD